MGIKCSVRKPNGQEPNDPDIDKGSYPRLVALTNGSWHPAEFHQPVVNGGPLK
jgi:hypothetical protein